MSLSLLEALPENFSFYHLGTVAAEPGVGQQFEFNLNEDLTEESIAIGFQLIGDQSGWLVILVDRGLDLDLYSELGNILASQFAARLSRQIGGDVLISPPRQISIATLARQLRANPPLADRLYWHVFDGQTSPVRTLVISTPGEWTEEGARA